MESEKNNLRWVGLSVLVFLADRISKFYIVQDLVVGLPKPVMPYLNFSLTYNKGTAFGMLNQGASWQFWLLSGVAILFCVAALIWLYRLPKSKNWEASAVALVLGGAIGNVWDRFAFGRVIDFIDFYIRSWHFATFNVADAAITVGAIMLMGELFFMKEKS